jgi:hypothetical protein
MRQVECRCDCGNSRVLTLHEIRRGNITSCGCFRSERIGAMNHVHGHTRRRHYSPEWYCWHTMVQCCYYEGHKSYQHYGGRGIQVCERWRNSFEALFEDMGPRPSAEHSIDRIDNDGDYCPENCRWATRTVQARNTRTSRMITLNGQTHCLTDWAALLGIETTTPHWRLKAGWSVDRALTTPLRGHLQLPCRENAHAISSLQFALDALLLRTEKRRAQGLEGLKDTPHT